MLECESQGLCSGRFHHLRQRLDELPFRIKKIAQLLDEELFNHLWITRTARRSIVHAGLGARRSLRCQRLERWSSHELKTLALIPRPAGVEFAVFSRSGGCVEELIDQAR